MVPWQTALPYSPVPAHLHPSSWRSVIMSIRLLWSSVIPDSKTAGLILTGGLESHESNYISYWTGLQSAIWNQVLPDPWITFSRPRSGTSGSMDYIFQSRRLRMLRILHRWSEAFHTLATGQPRRVISILVLKSCRKIYNAAFFLSWFCHISVIPVKPPDTAICPHVLWYTFTGLHFLRDIDSSAVRSVPRSVHYVSCLSS